MVTRKACWPQLRIQSGLLHKFHPNISLNFADRCRKWVDGIGKDFGVTTAMICILRINSLYPHHPHVIFTLSHNGQKETNKILWTEYSTLCNDSISSQNFAEKRGRNRKHACRTDKSIYILVVWLEWTKIWSVIMHIYHDNYNAGWHVREEHTIYVWLYLYNVDHPCGKLCKF